MAPPWHPTFLRSSAALRSLTKGVTAIRTKKVKMQKERKNKGSTDHLRRPRKPVLLLHVVVKGSVRLERLVTYLANLDKTFLSQVPSFQKKPVALPLQRGDSRMPLGWTLEQGPLGTPGCKGVSWQLTRDSSKPACAPSEPGHPGTWCDTWDRADPSAEALLGEPLLLEVPPPLALPPPHSS